MVQHCPIVLLLVEVVHARFLNTIGDADVDTVGREDSMNFIQHLLCIWAATVTAKNRVESSLVNNSIESLVRNLGAHLSDVHLFIGECWVLFSVKILHLFYNSEGDVNVSDVLVAFVKHFFRKS